MLNRKDKENLVTRVHYTYSGSKDVEWYYLFCMTSVVRRALSTRDGQMILQLTLTLKHFERIVVGWLEAALDLSGATESNIRSSIDKKATPVDNDLYFTWQDA